MKFTAAALISSLLIASNINGIKADDEGQSFDIISETPAAFGGTFINTFVLRNALIIRERSK
jgi:hypothetical protein